MTTSPSTEELDLFGLLEILLEEAGYWFNLCVYCYLHFIYQEMQPMPNFIATTDIEPINRSQFEHYTQSNAKGFNII